MLVLVRVKQLTQLGIASLDSIYGRTHAAFLLLHMHVRVHLGVLGRLALLAEATDGMVEQKVKQMKL